MSNHFGECKTFCTDGVIFNDERLVVPRNLKNKFLTLLHLGHFGITKAVAEASELYYWPSMNSDVINFVKNCAICEKFQANNRHETLMSIELPKNVFEVLGIDFAELKGESFIILVDNLSKWLEISKVSSHHAKTVINAVKPIFATHGYLKEIICDYVPFGAKEFKEFIEKHNGKV